MKAKIKQIKSFIFFKKLYYVLSTSVDVVLLLFVLIRGLYSIWLNYKLHFVSKQV